MNLENENMKIRQYKPKILLYGNCQFAIIARWLKGFECIEILKPTNYGVKIKHPWENSLFFPGSILKKEVLLRALNDADYFIFHDVVNPKFFTSKDLYDQFDSKKICITNFYLKLSNKLNKKSITNTVKAGINELVSRASIMESKYGSDCIDMSKWMEDNWQKKLLWGDTSPHPTMLYYIELFNQLKNKLFLDLDIDPTENVPKYSHLSLPKEQIVRIQEIFPNIVTNKDFKFFTQDQIVSLIRQK